MMGATQINVRPTRDRVDVKYSKESGEIKTQEIDRANYPIMMRRLKVVCRLDSNNTTTKQAGWFGLALKHDVHVSISPGPEGESIQMTVTPKKVHSSQKDGQVDP